MSSIIRPRTIAVVVPVGAPPSRDLASSIDAQRKRRWRPKIMTACRIDVISHDRPMLHALMARNRLNATDGSLLSSGSISSISASERSRLHRSEPERNQRRIVAVHCGKLQYQQLRVDHGLQGTSDHGRRCGHEQMLAVGQLQRFVLRQHMLYRVARRGPVEQFVAMDSAMDVQNRFSQQPGLGARCAGELRWPESLSRRVESSIRT